MARSTRASRGAILEPMQSSFAGTVDQLCEGLGSSEARRKYGSAKELVRLSAEDPAMLYSHFDFFVQMLDHDARVLRWNATRILGHLARCDHQGRIEKLLPRYLKPIVGPEMIGAANAIQGAAEIALAKPGVADAIAKEILKVRRARYRTDECRNIAAGHAIQALTRIFPLLENKKAVMKFVELERVNPRPATRKKAEKFLKKWTS